MKHELYESTSRRTTPWTGLEDASPMQIFINGVVEKAYESKHQKVYETHEEVELLNSYKPEVCPYCAKVGLFFGTVFLRGGHSLF